jgi:hypothetical protein
MFTRRFRSTIVAGGAATALLLAGCGDSPDPDAPVDPEDRTQVETPIDSEDVPQSDTPQNLDDDVTESIPGATPGPGADDIDEDVDDVVPDANTPASSSTVPGGDLPPG